MEDSSGWHGVNSIGIPKLHVDLDLNILHVALLFRFDLPAGTCSTHYTGARCHMWCRPIAHTHEYGTCKSKSIMQSGPASTCSLYTGKQAY